MKRDDIIKEALEWGIDSDNKFANYVDGVVSMTDALLSKQNTQKSDSDIECGDN